jgi:3-oxoacyl-[acyl-carrier protein] reductase
MTPHRHHDRIVLVTGAANGIGASISKQYAQEGAKLALVDVNEAALVAHAQALEAYGAQVSWSVVDVSDYAKCDKALNELTASLGGTVDILINNAGISPKTKGEPTHFWEMDPEEWMHVVGVNLNGAFNWSRLVTPSMVNKRLGAIVNMSSVAAKFFVSFTGAHYGTTKAALIGFTRDLAAELGPYGITVNAIAPGRIKTPLMLTANQATNDAILAQTALRKFGEPEDVAEMACFLTSKESHFVTGQTVDVAGGWLMT